MIIFLSKDKIFQEKHSTTQEKIPLIKVQILPKNSHIYFIILQNTLLRQGVSSYPLTTILKKL
jgi:hypothetical protein